MPTRTAAGLNPRYTFETFVNGASNQFALAAALPVAETPARSYNPLFIYGAAGLGKTHLLHAIGHYVHSRTTADYQVRYVSTETFLNEYVDAIRTNTTASVQAPLPRDRRAAHRRHPVHGGQGRPPGGVLPHVQLAARRQQADRHLLGPHARRHPHARGPPARPVQVGPHHRHPAARPRDPPGHPAQQGRARPQPACPPTCSSSSPRTSPTTSASSRAPSSGCTAYASLNHVPLTTAARRAAPRRPPERHISREPLTPTTILDEIADDLRLHRRGSCGARAASARSSPPARSACTSSASSPTSATRPSPASSAAATTPPSSTPSRRSQRLMKERQQIYDQVTELVQRIKSGA